MSNLLGDLEQSVLDREQSALACRDYFTEHEAQIVALLEGLKDASILRVTMDTSSIDFGVSGNKDVLKHFWHQMRTMGYETEYTPEENEVSFSCWWRKEDHPTIWLSFTSTICKRVKVGTETREIDVYEVVCE